MSLSLYNEQPLIIIDEMSFVVHNPKLWETEQIFVAELRESIHMNYFNVIFIASENSIVKQLHFLSGYSVLRPYQLTPPNDTVIADYYSSLGISEAKDLASYIGLNFRFILEILQSNSTSTTALKGKSVLTYIIGWLNKKRVGLTTELQSKLGDEVFLQAQNMAQKNNDPANWTMNSTLKAALIDNNVLVQQGWYKKFGSNEVRCGILAYYSPFLKYVLLETQFQSLTQHLFSRYYCGLSANSASLIYAQYTSFNKY
eukprot:TRINITY_DN557_c0_g1_i3.p2 TRINITY_DN557_c0_g1~~TRINITY_DN557_c0_g1_i3.p2  ORF type:complete len:257 (+),score=0.41 TRINITY_DN557_c0_g1_i3:1183-1953(+)